jgi:NAD(P)-dependent dehydrogenase (short-subunit alcohol dehydrogenase family)
MTHTLVIGGTRGLGREVVKQLSASGHMVSVIGRREPLATDRDIPNTKVYLTDLNNLASFKVTLAEVVKTRGKLSYLVFCQRYRGKDDDWRGEFDITLTATKVAVEALENEFTLEGDKGIVVVSSVFGDYVGEGQAVSYHMGKAGLNQMMRFYAVNLGRKGIRVNGVTPFTFLKEESKDFYLNNKLLHDLYCKIIPLGRMPKSEDSAKTIVFLCSSQAGFINGQNIYVDGGLSLVWPETLARKLAAL